MDKLLSVKEVADLIDRSEHTVRYWLVQGTGPVSVKLGRRRMFRPADVEAWVDAHLESA